MKATIFMIAMLVVLGLASCTSASNDPVEDNNSTYLLEKTYGAGSITPAENNSNNLNLEELPAVSVSEADQILKKLRMHTNMQESNSVKSSTNGDKTDLTASAQQTIDGQYTFTINLKMTQYSNGTLLYGGYTASVSSDLFKWYIKGFNFSSNKDGNYKYNVPGYIYFKIADEGIKYVKIPFTVSGSYNPKDHSTLFSYQL